MFASAVVVFAVSAAAPLVAPSAVPPADSSALIDTVDTAASAVSAAAPSTDTAASADIVPPPDSSAALPVGDTAVESVAADASTVSQDISGAGAIDGTELADLSLQGEPEQPFPKVSNLLRWLLDNAFYIIFFIASLAVIAATIIFFLTRRDTRRFLTTTRLSVLDKMVQKGCRYIESNYMNPELSVSLVCKELITGEAYLDTLFVKEIGVDVMDFITQVRVDRLKKTFLKERSLDIDIDIDSVCRQCGFADRATAERSFAKLNGGAGIDGFLEKLKNPLTSGQT